MAFPVPLAGIANGRWRCLQYDGIVATAVEHGCHVLLIDVLPPGPLDPDGLHAIIWDQLAGESFTCPPDRPLLQVAYRARPQPVAYVEPCAVGDTLPEMPLFLDAEWYVLAPLEETYGQAWRGFPAPWKEIVHKTT